MRTIVRKINIKSDGEDWWIHSKDIELYCRSIEEINSHPQSNLIKYRLRLSFNEQTEEIGWNKETHSFNKKKTSIIELYTPSDDQNKLCYISIKFYLDTRNFNIIRSVVRFINNSLSEGLVYFVQGGPFVKIGHVKKNDKKIVDNRIKTIQTSCPYKLRLLLIEFGGYDREQELHKQFERYKAYSEWFHFSEEIKEYIEKHAS